MLKLFSKRSQKQKVSSEIIAVLICEAIRIRVGNILDDCKKNSIDFSLPFLHIYTYHYCFPIIRKSLTTKYSDSAVKIIMDEAYSLFYKSVELLYGPKLRKCAEESFVFVDLTIDKGLDIVFNSSNPLYGLEFIAKNFLWEIASSFVEYEECNFSKSEITIIMTNVSAWIQCRTFIDDFDLCPATQSLHQDYLSLRTAFFKCFDPNYEDPTPLASYLNKVFPRNEK